MEKFTTIDSYLGQFNGEIRARLDAIRSTIRAAVPDAEERISYQMPTFSLNGNLIHFAAFKNHIGVYPTPDGIEAFTKDLEGYKNAKGSVQFPHDLPLPLDLIGRIAQFRGEENRAKAPKGKKSK